MLHTARGFQKLQKVTQWPVFMRVWCTGPQRTHTNTLFRLIWGDVICLVSSHLQSFCFCLLWHDVYIVLSTPTPELVFKSRFNLHASCLQEEEVEEFRVSLSWSWFHPVSVWTSRNSVHLASPPPWALHAPSYINWVYMCVCLCLCVINPFICSAHFPWTILKSVIDPLIVCPVHMTVCLSHIVANDEVMLSVCFLPGGWKHIHKMINNIKDCPKFQLCCLYLQFRFKFTLTLFSLSLIFGGEKMKI